MTAYPRPTSSSRYNFQSTSKPTKKEKLYLALRILLTTHGEVHQTRRQEYQHLLRFSYLILSPPRWALRTNFFRHHSVHNDVVTVLAKVVHNRCYPLSEFFTLWVVATVVSFWEETTNSSRCISAPFLVINNGILSKREFKITRYWPSSGAIIRKERAQHPGKNKLSQ